MKSKNTIDLFSENKVIAGKFFPAIISFIILVFFDQISKYIVMNKMDLYDSIPIIPDILEIHYIQNPGTAWGLLPNQQLLFCICTAIVVVFCWFILYRCIKLDRYHALKWLVVLIISGGIGNFIDRIRFQYVIDFIYFKCINFPVFNIADCYVTVSFFFLIYLILFKYSEDDIEAILNRKK